MFKNLLFLLLIINLIPIVYSTGEYYVDDTVYIDSMHGLLNVTPHHLTRDGYIYGTIKTYAYTGNFNVMFGFDSTNAIPKSIDYLHTNGSWVNINDNFNNYDIILDNKDLWYYANNFYITANQDINFRFYLDLQQNDGKYDIAFYPSSYGANYLKAYIDGNMILLDPTYNLTDSLVAYYKFDGDATDIVGSNDLTVTGATNDISYGKINEGYDFSGSAQYMKKTTGSYGTFNSLTINFWIKPDVTSSSDMYFFDSSGQDSHRCLIKIRESDGTYSNQMNFEFNDGSATGQIISTSEITTGNFEMWTFIYDGTSSKIYKNAIEETLAYNSQSATGDLDLDTIFELGASISNTVLYNGKMDEVGLWSKVLSPQEITEIYNDGIGLQYPFIAYPQIFYINTTANNELFINNTIFDVNDIIFNSTFLINTTINDSYYDYSIINYTDLPNGNYLVNFSYFYNSTEFLTTSNYSFSVDYTPPSANVTNLTSDYPLVNPLVINECPENLPSLMLLCIPLFLGLIFVYMAFNFKIPLLHIIGGLFITFCGYIFIDCNYYLGVVVITIGFLLIPFAFMLAFNTENR